MKRMSLKWKVTLWYAVMLLLLVLLLFGFLLSMSDREFRLETASALEDEVWDFIEEMEIDADGWALDGDVRFYKNDVMFSMYDENGYLIAGDVPENFPAGTTLKAYVLQDISDSSGKWATYDAAVPYGNGEILWVRGIYAADTLTTMERIMFRMLLIAFPTALLIALFVGYSITRRALLPVETIRKTADEIGNGRDLKRRIYAEGAVKEVQQLADTFNHMFARLENSFEKERQFTSDASHELRTPLAVIRSQAEYALLPDTDTSELREGMEVIQGQAERMSELLSQLLLLARTDNGREKLSLEKLDMSTIAMDALENVQKKAETRRIALLSQVVPGLYVQADRGSLIRVFQNLLENAVQYGKEDGWIRLTAFKEKGFVVCRIEDNGIGIDKEHLDKIWNRFYRVDTVRGASDGNSGLGLAIVKWIVEEHGGTIEVESQPGEGSAFTLRLPEAAS